MESSRDRRKNNKTRWCRPRAFRRVFTHGFIGIVGCLADIRSAKAQGAPKAYLLTYVERTNRCIVTERQQGRISTVSAADEALRNLEIADDCGVESIESIVACRLLLHWSREGRPDWEIEEADQRLRRAHDRLSIHLEAIRSTAAPKRLLRELSLIFGVMAVVAENDIRALEAARQAMNLAWEHQHALYRLSLLLLIQILDRRGETEVADALRRALNNLDGEPGGEFDNADIMLGRTLWFQ